MHDALSEHNSKIFGNPHSFPFSVKESILPFPVFASLNFSKTFIVTSSNSILFAQTRVVMSPAYNFICSYPDSPSFNSSHSWLVAHLFTTTSACSANYAHLVGIQPSNLRPPLLQKRSACQLGKPSPRSLVSHATAHAGPSLRLMIFVKSSARTVSQHKTLLFAVWQNSSECCPFSVVDFCLQCSMVLQVSGVPHAVNKGFRAWRHQRLTR